MHSFTADICDKYQDKVGVLGPEYKNFGGTNTVYGEIVTIKLKRDNQGLISLLKQEGKDRVVAVDVEGEYFAVVGENLVKLAFRNGWRGIVINGYVRDTHITPLVPVGLWALGSCPRKSFEKNNSFIGTELNFNGVKIKSGDYLLADLDGIVIIPKKIAPEIFG
jgi:regulator of ribonuclease activity A